MSNETKRDLVLAPGTYAYMQDTTKGVVKTYTGPTVINPTAQEVPVVYDRNRGTFRPAANLGEAQCNAPVAGEGYYMTLLNPAKDNRHPEEGSAQPSADLLTGRTINIPGPTTFALWPGQVANVVEGHHLRSNQYLLVRVYNEDEARKNWSKAVVKAADATNTEPTENKDKADAKDGKAPTKDLSVAPKDLTVGRQLIIRGTEVSFYIPPTGIEVVQEGDEYVRDALTLERLEYAILVDENGKKRFEIGPQVVFPTPSEKFIETREEKGLARKFRAIELNEIQGLHVKVIADYEDEITKKKYTTGEELFITGKDTSIYFPREEQSVIKYDGKTKHFATAIPVGEARYVMNRLNGEIRMVKGPAMLLPDPRNEVIVRRVLSDSQCARWYPGNEEALEYNRQLRQILASVPTTRSGAISEGDFERNSRNLSKGGSNQSRSKGVESFGPVAAAAAPSAQYASLNSVGYMESSKVSGDQNFALEEFSRSATYTQPRTLTLDTKFQGVPSIDVWNGYAAMVVSKTGKRRVEQGPTTILMEYDESLEVLDLSTGKPKTTDRLLKTPFLQIRNNKVSDIVEVETADHVKVEIYLSNHVNFVGEDPSRWFQVDNYVKFLCDHVRSILKGQVQKLSVENFYSNSTDLIRDFILGKPDAKNKRHGMFFEQNSMQVSDVEVLKVVLKDEKIRILLDTAQHEVVRTNLEVSSLRRNLQLTKDKETITRDELATRAETQRVKDELTKQTALSSLEISLLSIQGQFKQAEEAAKIQELSEESKSMAAEAELGRISAKRQLDEAFAEAEAERKRAMLEAETKAAVERLNAAQGGFSEALLALSNNDTLIQVAKAWDTSKMIAGESLADTLDRIFKGTPLKPLIQKIGHATNGDASKLAGPKGQLPG